MKIILLFLILVVIPHSVFSAKLTVGEMDGSIKFHNKKFVATEFIVRTDGSDEEPSYSIEMIHEESFYKFEELNLIDETNMIFFLDTGQQYKCTLSSDEKAKSNTEECKDKEGYCGECLQADDEEKQKLIIINIKLPPAEL